jgi:hypothetical protein
MKCTESFIDQMVILLKSKIFVLFQKIGGIDLSMEKWKEIDNIAVISLRIIISS